ncbi:MAG: hypothetical protein JXL80_03650 [Planctomycetes bacterium]|nr:hypothetical protein [Planctomycetota bacterium]
MNRRLVSVILATAVVAVLPWGAGCHRGPGPIVEVPPAVPRDASTDNATGDAASQQGASDNASTLPADDTVKSPDDVARKVAELEAALARRTPTGSGQTTSSVQTGGSSADDNSQTAGLVPQKAGEVSLTTVQPVGIAQAGTTSPADESATESSAPATEPKAEVAPAEAVTLETLIDRYREMAARRPADVEVARTLRFLHFAAGQDEKSLEAIAGLPPAEQKLWRDLMWTLIVARDRTPGTNRSTHAGEVLDALDEVRSDMLPEAPLEMGEVRFCDEIQRFGVYTPTTANRFLPGQSLLLYTEVRKFTSKREGDGLYHVRLAERLSLENEDGAVVWRHNFENIDDTCRTPRQDFFLGTTLPLPAKLPAGRYVLKVLVEDAATSRSAGARLELEIATSR